MPPKTLALQQTGNLRGQSRSDARERSPDTLMRADTLMRGVPHSADCCAPSPLYSKEPNNETKKQCRNPKIGLRRHRCLHCSLKVIMMLWHYTAALADVCNESLLLLVKLPIPSCGLPK